MNVSKAQTLSLLELIACALIMFGITELINHTENVMKARRQSLTISSNSSLPQGRLFIKDEERISNLFIDDTLPRLIQYGLVKKYELTQSKTVLYVNGAMWKHRSEYFKNCLLTEILFHNRTNGYSPKTEIIDHRSGRLFAKISPTSAFTFFD